MLSNLLRSRLSYRYIIGWQQLRTKIAHRRRHSIEEYLKDITQARSIAATASLQSTESQRTANEKVEKKRRRKELKKQKILEDIREKEKNKAIKDRTAEYSGDTKRGEKKDTTCPLPGAYSPRYVEAAWYDWWVKEGFFRPDSNQPSKNGKTFAMVLPPPNVTGSLHIGHALGNSIQDAIVRWHRMSGYDVLWNPGCDHAGIATQVRVEKQLWADEKKTRHDLGRELFVKKVWDWKNEKGTRIYEQMARLGSALDWSRACFTMDPKMCTAVNEAFIRLYEEGLIYRSKRMVNWSCTLKSAISDLEVEYTELTGRTKLDVPGCEKKIEFGVLTSFAYPVVGQDAEIVVATTRPETLLGDTAVAVHPDDARYTALHGAQVRHPLCDRTLPVMCDAYVSPDFGTGAVKITPAHDVNDYEIGLRHNLPMIDIIDDDGKLINVPEQFKGLPRLMARRAVVGALREAGLHRGEQDHAMAIPVCSRSNDVIEPRLKDQWFVSVRDMAQQAVQAVEDGRLEMIPENYVTEWKDWLEKTGDWCISRQLWWGHQVPAYRVTRRADGETAGWVTAHTKGEAVKKACDLLKCSESDCDVTQDEDVLDTWFSSALFPFAVFGWPAKTEDLAKFYPTSLLETASDIMFFWVARMVMLGQKLTGQLPFKKVLFHSILLDSYGRKMSKSLGNVVDPMDVINGISLKEMQERLESEALDPREIQKARAGQVKEFPMGIKECGADALRFSLCRYRFKSKFTQIDTTHIHADRLFCNKIYQTFFFIRSKLGDVFIPTDFEKLDDSLSPTDRWMLSCMSDLVKVCDDAFHTYDLFNATDALKRFWKDQLSGIYCEYVKEVYNLEDGSRRRAVQNVLLLAIDTGVRALAPFMPYLSEELYQRLPNIPHFRRPASVCIAPYPKPSEYLWKDGELEKEIQVTEEYASAIARYRKDLRLDKWDRLDVFLRTPDVTSERSVANHAEVFHFIASTDHVTFLSASDRDPDCCCRIDAPDGASLYLQLKGMNIDQQRARLTAVIEKYRKQLTEHLEKLEKGIVEAQLLATQEKVRLFKDNITRLEGSLRALEEVGKKLS